MLFEEDRGSGEQTLLLLHGWCDSCEVFSRLRGQLEGEFRVLSLDFPGHGRSKAVAGDFGYSEFVAAAADVIRRSGSSQVIPVAASHSGWVAVELRRRMEAVIPKLVLLDWIVLDPPPPFIGALGALQDPAAWQTVREKLFEMWNGSDPVEAVANHIENVMRPVGADMWARAGREISSAYARWGSPLKALSALEPRVQALHVYSQPGDPGYLEAQRGFSKQNSWFQVQRLDGRTHFPTLESPEAVAHLIRDYVRS